MEPPYKSERIFLLEAFHLFILSYLCYAHKIFLFVLMKVGNKVLYVDVDFVPLRKMKVFA